MIRTSFDALVCDMDGVIYRGDTAIPGAIEALERLRAEGVRVIFCTNNSRATIDEYVAKLRGMGIDVEPADIVTSAVVTAETLQARGLAGHTAIVVGGPGVREALGAVCISVKQDPSVTAADLVVVGWTPEFDYADMKRAATAIRKGATFIATNDDATFPASDGLWPGAGSIVASIQTASGARPEVMGKPHPPMMDAVARRLEGYQAIAMVGDRPDTDLAGGAARGWRTILVLTGVTSEGDLPHLEVTPDVIVGSLAELTH